LFIRPRVGSIRFTADSDSSKTEKKEEDEEEEDPSEEPGSEGTFSFETIEPELIENSAASDTVAEKVETNTEQDSVFGNKIVIGAFDERQMLISSISRLKFQLGDYNSETFTTIKVAYSLSSGNGSMSTNANPDNSGIKIAMYDNGFGQSSWSLISQEAASAWNYTGANGQKYNLSYIVNFPVIYVLYDSTENITDLTKEFKKNYSPISIGNVYYPKQVLSELTSSRNNWDELFTAVAPGAASNRKKLFYDKGERLEPKKVIHGSGEEIQTPNFNMDNP